MAAIERAAALALAVSVGAASPTARAQELLTVTFDTTPAAGRYAPRNILAVWIEMPDGTFVRTIGRWAGRRIDHLVAWSDASGQDMDAVSGATLSNHGTRTVVWDMTDRDGAVVPDGPYVVRMELADSNATDPSQNNEGSFPFDKDGAPFMQTTAGGGFENVVLVYTGRSADASCVTDCVDAGPGDAGVGPEPASDASVARDAGADPPASDASADRAFPASSPGPGGAPPHETAAYGCDAASGGGPAPALGLIVLAVLSALRRRRRPRPDRSGARPPSGRARAPR